MGSDSVHHGPNSVENIESLEVVLTRVGLDLACTSEKLVNLDLLILQVDSRENDFEAFYREDVVEDSAERALEFDHLYGILDSQVREVEGFLSDLESEIANSRELISSSSFKQLDYVRGNLEEKLQGCEDSLKLSLEQVSDIKTRSDYFQRILLASSRDENWVDNKELSGLGNNNGSDLNLKLKMQTAEQKRDILRMLEKSLAREMDLEKKLSDSRKTEEDLKLRLQEEEEEVWERLLEAENSSEILLGISMELRGQLQTAQNSINESVKREMELRSKLQDLSEQLKEKDCDLSFSEVSRTELVEKVRSLEQSSKDMEMKATEAENKMRIFESESKLLRESNMELNKDVVCLKSSIADATETVEQLKRQLKATELRRLHATATAEASQENETMSKCTIRDMESLIKDLKCRVVNAESQTESAEEMCITLSESNMDLVKEVSFLRRKTEHLESSLQRAAESKKETAKGIRLQTESITDLVVQLALERERLRKQISSFAKQQKVSVNVIGSHDAKAEEDKLTEKVGTNGTCKESNKETMGSSITSYESGDEHMDSTAEISNSVRNIDPSCLDFKSLVMLVLAVLVIPAFTGFLIRQSGVPT